MGVQDKVISAANRYGVDPALALAVARQESGFSQVAVSRAGAVGVMQLMPGTAADLKVDPWDEDQNIDGGVRYLAEQLRRFGGNVQSALAAYNFGPGAVAAGRTWPAETVNYVGRVLAYFQDFAGSLVFAGSGRPAESADFGFPALPPAAVSSGAVLLLAAALIVFASLTWSRS